MEDSDIVKKIKMWVEDSHETINRRPLVWGGTLIGLEDRMDVLDTVDFMVNYSRSFDIERDERGFMWRNFLEFKFPKESVVQVRGSVALFLQEKYQDDSLAEFMKLRKEFAIWRQDKMENRD